jgi:hypothetical protein
MSVIINETPEVVDNDSDEQFFNEPKDNEKDSSLRDRYWVSTWNNYPIGYSSIFSNLLATKLTWLCYSEEVAPTTGTKHLQIAMAFKSPISRNAVKKCISKEIYVAKMNGTCLQSRIYCSKGSNPTYKEFGVLPLNKGREKHMMGIIASIQGGLTKKELLEQFGSMASVKIANTIKALDNLYSLYEPSRPYDKQPDVIWVWGQSGAGKSRYAKAYAPDNKSFTWSSMTSKWCNGYDGEELMIIDDFRYSFCPFLELLKICSNDPYQIEQKGSFRQLKATTIIITSQVSPIDAYQFENENITQLLRRIKSLVFIKSRSDQQVLTLDYITESISYESKFLERCKKQIDFCVKNNNTNTVDKQISAYLNGVNRNRNYPVNNSHF